MDNERIASRLVELAKELTDVNKMASELGDLEPDQQKKVLELIEAKEKVAKTKKAVKIAAGKLQADMRALEKKAKNLDKELGPVIAGVEDQLIRAQKAIVKYDPKMSTRPAYKTAFDSALTKVNANTKAVLEECLEASRKISTYLDVSISASESRIARRRFSGIMTTIKNVFSSMWKWLGNIKAKAGKLENSVDQLEKVVK